MSKKINLTILVSIILCVLFSCVSNKNTEVANTPVTPPVQEETQNIQKLILEGRTTEAKELFQAKIDINEMDENGNTALHTAARINEADLVTFLIYKGANVELKNHDGDTPLHIAIKNNAKECTSILAAVKTNIFARDGNGKTALELGLAKGYEYYDALITTKSGLAKDD